MEKPPHISSGYDDTLTFVSMVVHMLIKLVLTRHNNRSFAYLQRHDETCRTP